jgi:quercetin dioxygenase-like cupin family protein
MLRTFRIGHAVLALGCLGLVFAVSVGWIGRAQQPATPTIPAPASTGVPVEAAGFVGKTAMLDTTGYTIGRRIFAPGSHNATWHKHTAGQLIFAESGHGRFQIQGQPIHELAPGESGYIPPGVMHWHGSVRTESFTMTFITMGASTTSQGEAISEDVYLGKK